MTFNIYFVDIADELKALYEIVLGDSKEDCALIATLWARETYEKQWCESSTALVDGGVQRCVLVTDVQSVDISGGITY